MHADLRVFHENLNEIPPCQTLSKALEISKNILLTSIVGSQSEEEFVLWAIDNNCETQETPGRNPNLYFFKTSFL